METGVDLQSPLEERPELNEQEWLVRFLRERDVECPGCEYNLRGLSSNRCPECGQTLRLRVNLAEPYLTAWIVLMAAAGANAGMGCFFLMAVLRAGWPTGPDRFVHIAIAIELAMIPVMPIVLITRKKIVRIERPRQWLLAVSAAFILLICMALVFAGMG